MVCLLDIFGVHLLVVDRDVDRVGVHGIRLGLETIGMAGPRQERLGLAGIDCIGHDQARQGCGTSFNAEAAADKPPCIVRAHSTRLETQAGRMASARRDEAEQELNDRNQRIH